MNMAGDIYTTTNFKQALSTTRHLFLQFIFQFFRKAISLLSFNTPPIPTPSLNLYSQPMTFPHIIKKIEAFLLEFTPASILNQLSAEKALVNVISESTLLNPIVNSQS